MTQTGATAEGRPRPRGRSAGGRQLRQELRPCWTALEPCEVQVLLVGRELGPQVWCGRQERGRFGQEGPAGSSRHIRELAAAGQAAEAAGRPRGTRPGRALTCTLQRTPAWRCRLGQAIGSVRPVGRPPPRGPPARPPRLQEAQRVPLRSQLQVTLLSKFLLVAKSCYEQRNFATAMQILGGLEHPAVRQCPVSALGATRAGSGCGAGSACVTWAFLPGLEDFTCEDGGGHGGAEGRGGTAAWPELPATGPPGAPAPRGPLTVLPGTARPGPSPPGPPLLPWQRRPGARGSRSPPAGQA